MNILFFLTPKSEVAYISDDDTLRQALEKMEHHRYSAIPILDKNGAYIGTITEGDLLWYIKNSHDLNVREAESIMVTAVPRHSDNAPVHINADIEDLLTTSMLQNFIPVLDDHDTFIGLITRKDIIQYCYGELASMPRDRRKVLPARQNLPKFV